MAAHLHFCAGNHAWRVPRGHPPVKHLAHKPRIRGRLRPSATTETVRPRSPEMLTADQHT